MRERILHLLAEAAEMEHNLLCSYLYAAFSLRREGEGLDAAEAAAVGRWRKAIVGVAVEEMGHLATVNNLMVALGGAAHFDRPNFPVPPGYLPASFEVALTPLDEATLEHLIFLERPQSHANSSGREQRTGGKLGATPSARDYETIGELYALIRNDLRAFAASSTAGTFVCTDSQVNTSETGIPGVVVITDLASALAALGHIVDQGEGAAEESENSHFARFTGIRREWSELKAGNPRFLPAHPAARNPVMRRPRETTGHVWVTAPDAAALLDYGNAVYGTLLTLLAQLYLPAESPQKKKLAAAAIELMHALSLAGNKLARLPARLDLAGVNAGLSFAVPRARGPRAHTRLIGERLGELAEVHERVLGGRGNPPREAAARLAG